MIILHHRIVQIKKWWFTADIIKQEIAYSDAAEPSFRYGESHQSGTTEPLPIPLKFYLIHTPHALKYP